MALKVFISYRRADSAAYAGRIHDRLEKEFGRDALFMDVDAIPLGANFVRILREEVSKCDVFLALIGTSWFDTRDEIGTRRLENPNDFVRVEIATALRRRIPVVPILLDGAKLPRAEQLPRDIQELALRNALDVRHGSFHSDVDKLIRGLKNTPSSDSQPRQGDLHEVDEEGFFVSDLPESPYAAIRALLLGRSIGPRFNFHVAFGVVLLVLLSIAVYFIAATFIDSIAR